jgi:TPR repeat protein
VTEDEVKAAHWYAAAAAQGHAHAQYYLGMFLLNAPVNHSLSRQQRWPISVLPGLCYMQGRGVPEDEAKAVHWYAAAAAGGLARAQYALGMCAPPACPWTHTES